MRVPFPPFEVGLGADSARNASAGYWRRKLPIYSAGASAGGRLR
jgi:hypothetical protein